MKNNKKIIAAAVLAAVIALTGCSIDHESTPASFNILDYSSTTTSYESSTLNTYDEEITSDYGSESSSVSVSDSVSEPETVESDSESDYYDDILSRLVCSVERFDNSEPEVSNNDDGNDTPSGPVCTVSWNDSDSDAATSSSSSSSSSSYGYRVPESVVCTVERNDLTVSGSVSAIKQVCGLKSEVETDIGACIVDTYNDHNPYDVAYDYGKTYDAFVSACDWSLVFDADFYAKSFPLLAMQYHDDKVLLLEHFQTVGIHEGRQGSKSFNVGVYKANCGSDIKDAFGNNYEGYYFYYMLNHDSEKSVNSAPGSNSKIQQKTIMTALQAAELDGVNMYRREVDVFEIEFDSELAAFANYRAYLNSHDGWKAHDWFRKDDVVTDYIMDLYDAQGIGENTTTSTCTNANCTSHRCNYGETRYEYYRASESHYKAMIASKNDLIGCGNCYKADGIVSQFDTFINL